ncbi:MAG: molecular chaperone DnaK, partial [Gammaproteobacteria bacterium]
SGDDKSKTEDAVAAVKEALKGSDAAAIKSAMEKLNEAGQKFSEILYKAAKQQAQSAKAGGGPTSSASSGGGDAAGTDHGPIIDAEVVDEKKK